MKTLKTVRDPIHGNISVSQLETELMDTARMQRLRNVKQNGFCFLVYPAMNSTRFEHSLGTMHLAGLMASHLELPADESQALRAASLLHDIGHGPFSHTSDAILTSHGMPHEENSAQIIRDTGVGDVLGDHGLDPSLIADIVLGKGGLGKLVSSEIDLDKMDYLVRDSYYAGVAYGVIDVERVLYSIKLVKDEVVLDPRGLEAVEALLISRNLMYQTVYRHHTKRIAEAMFGHALSCLLEDGVTPAELSGMDDYSLISIMRARDGYAGKIMECIDERRLFKKVFQERISIMTEPFRRELEENIGSIEGAISRDHGIDSGYALCDYPETRMNEFRVKVGMDGGLRRIDEVSTLAAGLRESEEEKLTFNIYVGPDWLDKIADFRPNKYIEYAQTRLGRFT
ncbi:HD domain-containing protein [Candidatus Altiarchaeota archaeon]